MKYTISDLRQDFPDDDACLEWLVEWLYPEGITCKKCMKITNHYRDSGRRSYSCGLCGLHFHPTAGTALHKTKIPLIYWMYAMHRMTSTRTGLPATQLQRELGITYKSVWNMLHKIREQMGISEGKLEGAVEIDETFIHGNVYKRSSAHKRYGRTGARQGQVVFGMVERNGRARLYHVRSTGTRILMPKIEQNIQFGSTIYTDGYGVYKTLTRRGYNHFSTNHSNFEWADGNNNVQSVESVWSRFKMGIKADYRHVSDTHLQKYCNEFAWRHSYRKAVSMFWSLVGTVAELKLSVNI